MTTDIKNKIVEIIKSEVWRPMHKTTDEEMFAADMLNKTLLRILDKIKEL